MDITMTCKLANICDLIAAAPPGVNQSNNYTQSKAESGSQGSAGEGATSSYKELEPAATAENDSTSSIPTKMTPVAECLPTKADPDNESSGDKCAGQKLQNAVVVHVHSVPE